MAETEQLDRIEGKVDKIGLQLFGNGSVGLCEKVRRLEKMAEVWKWAMRAVVLAAISLIAKIAHDLFS